MPLRRAPRPHGRQPLRVSPYRRVAHVLWAWGMPALILLFAVTRLVDWETERWWFQTMGQPDVYSRLFAWRCGAFFAAFALYAAILGWNARIAWNISSHTSAPLGWGELWDAEGGSRLIPLEDKLGLDRYRRAATIVVVALTACLAGSAAATNFRLWVEAAYASPTGIRDDLWGRDLSFFLFHLPALHALGSFIFWALLISLALSTIIYIYEEAVELGGRRAYISPPAMRHLAALFATMIAWKSLTWRLDALDIQSALNWSGTVQAGFFGYAAANYRLPALQIASWLAVPVALGMLYLAKQDRGRAVAGVGLGFSFAAWLSAALLPLWVQANRVDDDLQKIEGDFLARHRQKTLQSWGLENPAALPVNTRPSRALEDEIVSQLPVWPAGAVRGELDRQYRYHRSPLQTTTIHLERWLVNGEPRTVYVCAVQAPAGAVAEDGIDITPGLAVVDASQTSGSDEMLIYRAPLLRKQGLTTLSPELSPASRLTDAERAMEFGLWPSVPRTESEINGPGMNRLSNEELTPTLTGNADWTHNVPEESGVSTRSAWRRLLVAWKFLNTDLASDATPIQWHRDAVDRCRQLAPFLRWTNPDPRPVLMPNGRLLWLLDAFASSRHYPNASGPATAGAPFTDSNYCRHIVTATVDAATGEVNLYLLNPREPFSRIYARAFPHLFRQREEMPVELRRQWRPSEALFTARAVVWSRSQWGSLDKSWRPILSAFDGRGNEVVFRSWNSEKAKPFTLTGAAQFLVFQESQTGSGRGSSSTQPIKVVGAMAGADSGLDSAASALPRLSHWLPQAPISVEPSYAGNDIGEITQNAGVQAKLVQTTILPLGSGLGVAVSSSTPKQRNKNQDFATVVVKRAAIRDGNLRVILPEGLKQVGLYNGSGAGTRLQLQQARTAYGQWKAAQRRRDWQGMDRAWSRLDALLGTTSSSPVR